MNSKIILMFKYFDLYTTKILPPVIIQKSTFLNFEFNLLEYKDLEETKPEQVKIHVVPFKVREL